MPNVLCLVATSHNGTTVDTHRFSTIEYQDSGTGDEFDPVIVGDVITTKGNESIYNPKFSFVISSIEISNSSGDYDDLVNQNWTGRSFDLYFGNSSLPLSSLDHVKSGAMDGINYADESIIEFEFSDELLLLDQPVQPNEFNSSYATEGDPWPLTFGNAFTCEGVITTETIVPQTYWTIHTITLRTSDGTTPNVYSDYLIAGGKRITNGVESINQNADIQVIEPESVQGKLSVKQYVYNDDTVIYITGFDNYQVNGSPGPIDKENITWSGGTGILTFYQFDSATQTRFILKTGSAPINNDVITGAGGWTIDVNGTPSQAFIDSHPFFEEELRLDLSDDSQPTNPDPENEIQDVITNIVELALTTSQIDTASLTAFGTALGNYKSGIYIKDDRTVFEVLDEIMTIGTGFGFNVNYVDKLSFFELEDPGTEQAGDVEITIDDMQDFNLHFVHQPIWKIATRGAKNHHPMTQFFNGSQSSSSVPTETRQNLRKKFQRRAVESDTDILDDQIKPRSLVIDTIMNDTQVKLKAEATRIFDLYSVYRYVYRMTINGLDWGINITDRIIITHDRYGLENGEPCKVLKIETDYINEQMVIYAWR